MTQINECHKLVWQYREKLGDKWPTPPPLHALMFAVTEIGELFDAHMRTFDEYKRNNDRDSDVLDEAADVAMMLLTAVTETNPSDRYDREFNLTYLAHDVICAVSDFEYDDQVGVQIRILRSIAMIENMPGMDLYSRLEAKLEQTWEKFGDPQESNATH